MIQSQLLSFHLASLPVTVLTWWVVQRSVVATGTGKDKADPCVEKCVDECFNHLMDSFKDTEPGIVAFRLFIAIAAFPFFTLLTLACANGCIQEKCMGKSIGKSDA